MIFVDIIVVKAKFNIPMIDGVHERFMTRWVLRPSRRQRLLGDQATNAQGRHWSSRKVAPSCGMPDGQSHWMPQRPGQN
jgi:hypothetical protein